MKKHTNHQELRIIKLQKKKKNDGVPSKVYIASLVILRFGARNKKKKKPLWEYPVTNDA